MSLCTDCEALNINGLLCHEHGCPAERAQQGRTCPECGTLCGDRSAAYACCAPLDDGPEPIDNGRAP